MRPHVSIDELMDELRVSRETVRRDIQMLEAASKLRRVHGGVERIPVDQEPPLSARTRVHVVAKRRIGVEAARLVTPGMLCAVDAGSTTHAFAQALATVRGVQVVTNSLEIASLIGKQADSEVVLVGGRIRADLPGTYGELAVAEILRYAPDIAFFSPVCIDPQHGATSFQMPEAEFARAMLQHAKTTVMLADSSKLGGLSRIRVCDCRDIDLLVTDKQAPAESIAALVAAGVKEVRTA